MGRSGKRRTDATPSRDIPRPVEGATPELSALDAACLFLERPHQPLHMGCLVELAGGIPLDDLLERLNARLLPLRQFRQRPVRARLDLGAPVWEDDPAFDLRRHVRHVALPAPGDEQALQHVVETLFSTPLAQDRPLWEVHLIEGLAGGRAAILCKLHHCVNDGVSALRILEVIADPVEGAEDGRRTIAGSRASADTAADLAPDTAADFAPDTAIDPAAEDRHPTEATGLLQAAVEAALAVLPDRSTVLGHVREAAEAIATLAELLDEPDNPVPLTGTLGTSRQMFWRSFPIEEFRSLRTAMDCTINDAVLAVVAGGLRRHLEERGAFPDDLMLRAAVPVNVRGEDHGLAPGNLFTAMFPRLPIDVADPVDRVVCVREEMRDLKNRGQARATGLMLALFGSLPWPVEAALLQLLPDRRIVDTVCTNVPGPRGTLSLLGRQMLDLHPIVPLFQSMGVGFAIASYAGRISICATIDPSIVPDGDRLLQGVEDALYETRSALWARSEALAIAGRLARVPTVADLMTRNLVTVAADDSLLRAHDIMRTTRVRHVPVIDHGRRLIGVLTQRDLLVASPSAASAMSDEERERSLGQCRADEAARTRLTFVAPHESAAEAGRRMVENEVDFLPVIDEGGRLVGLVTEEQFVRWTSGRAGTRPA